MAPHDDTLGALLRRCCGARAADRAVLQRLVIPPAKESTFKLFQERPSEPERAVDLATTVYQGVTLPQTRHHMIPWNKLAEFARKAYEVGHAAELIEILTPAIATMIHNSKHYLDGKEVAAGTANAQAMQGSTTAQDLATELARTTGDPISHAMEAMCVAYCWMPGNLFLGPLNTLRIDDPGEDFERYAEDQVDEFAQFATAFDDISSYVKQQTPPQADAIKIASFLKRIAAKTTPAPFKEAAWTSVGDGAARRYYLKKAADSARVKAVLNPPPVTAAPAKTAKAAKPISAENLKRREEAAAKRAAEQAKVAVLL